MYSCFENKLKIAYMTFFKLFSKILPNNPTNTRQAQISQFKEALNQLCHLNVKITNIQSDTMHVLFLSLVCLIL